MWFDSSNPVVALCAEGMQVDGERAKALELFEQAWAIRGDDFDASVAAHFVARHQPSAALTLQWNEIALHHADALTDDRAAALLPSLCLNLGDSYLTDGRIDLAEEVAQRGVRALVNLPQNGYADFVRMGLNRLLDRVATTSCFPNHRTSELQMKRVTGIGGIFFKAKDAPALRAWYKTHLGIDVQPWGGASFDWSDTDGKPTGGTTAWLINPEESKQFSPSEASFMVNYRVEDLHALVAALKAEGCNVLDKIDDSEYGKFGWVIDPEGNKVEMWQPPAGQ